MITTLLSVLKFDPLYKWTISVLNQRKLNLRHEAIYNQNNGDGIDNNTVNVADSVNLADPLSYIAPGPRQSKNDEGLINKDRESYSWSGESVKSQHQS